VAECWERSEQVWKIVWHKAWRISHVQVRQLGHFGKHLESLPGYRGIAQVKIGQLCQAF